MLPSHYADPAGNQVAIPNADSLIALIRANEINGQTWVLTEEHDDWVTLDSQPEWPQWLAAAERPTFQFRPLPEDLGPAPLEPIRWPVKVGGLLLLLAVLVHFGLFYYTRGGMTADDFFEEIGLLVFVTVLSFSVGSLLQQRVDRRRNGQKPPISGLTLMTISVCLLITVSALGIHTWKAYQEKGSAGLAFEDSLRGVDPTIQDWARQMNEEYDAIYDTLDGATTRLNVDGLEGTPEAFTSLQAARDSQRRAREVAESFRTAATELRKFVDVTNFRLRELRITKDLKARQQKVFDEEFVPSYRAEAEFLAARGDAFEAMAELYTLVGDLIERGQFRFVNNQVEIPNDLAGAEYDRRLDQMIAKQNEADRLYQIAVELDAEQE